MQVEGEDAVGDVRLEGLTSLADVVERAVEKRRIRPIDWMDVAGWKLKRPDGSLVEEGGRSEPLQDLPTFPSKSLLTITRRTALSTASYPSSSSASSSSSSSTSSTARGKTKHRPENSICGGARDQC